MTEDNLNRRRVLSAMGLTCAALATGQLAAHAGAAPQAQSQNLRALQSVADFHRLQKSELQKGQQFSLAGYYAGSTLSGGIFVWDGSTPRAAQRRDYYFANGRVERQTRNAHRFSAWRKNQKIRAAR